MPKSKAKSKHSEGGYKSLYRLCVPPCLRYITGGDTHSLCVVCLGAKHAELALEGADCPHCERMWVRLLPSQGALFEEGAIASIPAVLVPLLLEFASGYGGGNGDRPVPISFHFRQIRRPISGVGSALCGPFHPGRGIDALLSSSKKVDVESVDMDSPPHSQQYEELLEVVTHTVAKLSIEWPAKKTTELHRSKLDERFLRASQPPPSWGLPFFPDLHDETARLWKRPFSARLYIPSSDYCGNLVGMGEHVYRAMPRVEQTPRELSVPQHGIISEGPGIALKATQNNIGFDGQKVCGCRSGWCMSAHHGSVIGVPSRPA
ncbi:sodium channel subunit beta-2 isoform X1 [Carassius gibelio]|uniref:sodium channel subunit beta-2 isoform X1 n=1 Tax=Carassius gibelio TaxID=101364 RepID=UPI0022782033|nr:sodium channel subunit beta-2 isoform X1 [Carassius gibelio]